MKKFLLSLFLLLTAVVSRAYDFKVDGIYYQIMFSEEQSVAVTYKGYDYKEKYSDSVIIPESVTYGDVTYKVIEIGVNAFYNCYMLTSVSIPDGVTRIGGSAFEACYKLTSVTIPNSVVVFEKRAFYNCEQITSVTIPDGVTWIVESVFSGCKALTSISIPNSVYMIGQNAFSNCINLISVSIGNGVTTIEKSTFQGCSALTSLTFGNGVTKIDNSAFYNCESLSTVIIPNSVTTIGYYAFQNCSALSSLTIGNSVKAIGGSAFQNCSVLKDVYCLAEHVPSAGRSFSNQDISSAILHVPATSLEAYSTKYPWSDFGQIVALGEGDGIEQLTSEEDNPAFANPIYYDLNGRRTTKMQKGINLLRSADGRVKKVIRSRE